ncbi:hypothetical protein LXL04_020342 [Taraxacum kok-saghyz]
MSTHFSTNWEKHHSPRGAQNPRSDNNSELEKDTRRELERCSTESTREKEERATEGRRCDRWSSRGQPRRALQLTATNLRGGEAVARSYQSLGVDNTLRRKFDKEEYLQRAREHEEKESESRLATMAVPLSNLTPSLLVSKLCLGCPPFSLLLTIFIDPSNFSTKHSIPESTSSILQKFPQRAETQGRSEEYFGRWLRERKIPRDRVVFATKTDYIDLYQIHWPDRYVPMFGETDYDPVRQYTPVGFDEQLDALGTAVDAGKIRFIGVSNETPYGVMKFLQAADNNPSYPRIATIQNSYNLLCRNFDSGLAECCHLERVRLLAYSPLAMGLLSGKYLLPDYGGDDARLNLFKSRYSEGESRFREVAFTDMEKWPTY